MNTWNENPHIGDKLATWLPIAAIIFVLANIVVFAYHWVMQPAHFLAVTLAVVFSVRYVRRSPSASIVLAVAYFIFFSAYVSHTPRRPVGTGSAALGTASGGMATATSGGVVR